MILVTRDIFKKREKFKNKAASRAKGLEGSGNHQHPGFFSFFKKIEV